MAAVADVVTAGPHGRYLFRLRRVGIELVPVAHLGGEQPRPHPRQIPVYVSMPWSANVRRASAARPAAYRRSSAAFTGVPSARRP
ncbi:hypothetical protein AB0C22_23185 [Micromonospora sp. NPDC048894]|uniref:hypothetical protein n=1 Tax=unclassified Micromonospora TaxID=2617518 RepID=UPI0033F94C91